MSSASQDVEVTADVARLLEVLSQRVCNDPYAAIREYVANAYDASVGYPDCSIRVRCDDRRIIIEDRGCGMTNEVILTAFSRIGGRYEAGPERGIGEFGLGVLTAFMISELLVVETRSEREPHGWRLEWRRGQQRFTLQAIARAERGTVATLHLSQEHRDMAYEAGIRDYVARVLGLLPMPIYVGRNGLPANAHHSWLREQGPADAGQLLSSPDVYDILRRYCQLELLAAYGATGANGARILLGIPATAHAPLQRHKVQFFSRGVWVCGELAAFFPENLAFVVSVVDHPGFSLQIDRESLRTDRAFAEVRDAIELHILRFLELLGEHQPKLLSAVMETHGTMLNAHRHRQPRLRALFRNHYRFVTSVGPKTWRDLSKLAHSATVGRTQYERLLFVLSESGADLQLQPIAARMGYPVVRATNGDRDLLEDFGRTDGVQIADIGLLMEGAQAEVPEAFRALAARLAPELNRHRVNAVTFFSLPGESLRPAELQIATASPRYLPSGENWVQVDSLMLNVAHPAIEMLAAKAHHLTDDSLASVTDALYAIAAVQSPLREAHQRVTGIVVRHLLSDLEKTLGSSASSAIRLVPARCFVALPYRPAFEPVWTAVQSVLEGAPYGWTVVRADQDIHEPSVLEGVLNHIENSRRFVADVSGESSSVLIELGMMLQKDAQSTLLLADERTFARMPTDIKGTICMVYHEELRGDPVKFKVWFSREVRARKHFIAMYGGNARHEDAPARPAIAWGREAGATSMRQVLSRKKNV
jgi:HSP90 family molecular chaperone